jgi:alanyl-tRNA synthetase
MVRDIHVMALEVPNSNADTLRTLADRFREKYPRNGIALLTSNGMVIAVVTEDLVKRGLKAGDLITSVGGRGGGRPNLAQGSLPDPALMNDAMDKMAKTVEEKLK